MSAYDLILKKIHDNKLVPNQKKGATVNHLTGFVNACKDKGLSYQKKGKFLIIKNKKGDQVIGGVSGMVSSFVSSFALQVCNDKTLTNDILKEAGFLVPKQFSFSLDEKEDARRCFLHNGVGVIKPSNGAGGKGVTVGMESEKDFEDGWEYACVNVNKNLTGGRVLLEEEVCGFDARVIVVNGKYCCAVTRVPAYVVGDGVQKLENLINKKNEIRKNHPHHKAFLIGLDCLSQVELSRVAGVGEVVWLSKLSNIHQGGEAIDITELLGPEVKDLAESISKSVPGLNVVGIDFLLSDFTCKDAAYVLELNVAANFSIHYFPYYGNSRNPAKMIVDDMLI